MADILSAASVLLAILTGLFGFYYPEITKIIELKPNTLPANDRANYKQALTVRKTKLYPLLISIVIVTALFIPELLKLLAGVWQVINNKGFKFENYDTIKAALIAVVLFMIALTINVCILTFKFFKQLKLINPKR